LGATLGSYINSQNLVADPYTNDMFRHEYGHTIQSRILGPLYLSHVAIPSLISEVFDSEVGFIPTSHSHDDVWFETNASRLGNRYFENHNPDIFDLNKGGQLWNDILSGHLDYRTDWFWWLIPL
jgi:hypothetical protein